MNDHPITINHHQVKAGECVELNLNTYRLPSRTDIHIPVYVYRGKQHGPVLLLTAGVHGDEINGIETLRHLIKHKYFNKIECGTIIVIPIVNIVSFLAGSRDLPDGKDLNRLFPGSKTGSLGSRIAFDMMHKILPLIDFGIDFHTGGHRLNNFPQIRCDFKDQKALDFAKLFEPPFIINSSYREGSFRQEASKQNKPILVYEGGESMRFNKLAITEGIHGCMRVLNKLKMIPHSEIPVPHTILIKNDRWLRAPASGLFRTTKKYGSFFEKDEVIGTVSDPYGEHETELFAPSAGFIMGINNQPVINEGDALIHLGMEE